MSNWNIPASQLPAPIPKDTLRAHFAGLAMQGLLASDTDENSWLNGNNGPEILAGWAVKVADALIERLSK